MIKKKILIWHWGRRGGGPRYTFELVRALKEHDDLEIHLSLSRQSEIFEKSDALGLPSCHINTYNNLFEALIATLRLPFIRYRFWRYVKQHNIDIVICTMSHLWDVPMLAGHRRNVPYLFVLHDALPHPGDDILFRQWWLKREIGYADGVVALTEHVRSILINEHNYPKIRTWVAPHGVFLYNFPPKQFQPDKPLRLLFFGRILPYKGLDLLLDAYGTLRAEGNNVELLICGSGDMQPYKSKIATLEGITIVNRWIGEADMGPIFQQIDISVSPYREASQSGVIATAYAAGIPVVVTPIGGLVEQVIHEQTGLISKEATAESIADALRRMLSDSALRKQCAEGAREMAQGTLSWPTIAKQFKGAIDGMLSMEKR